MTDLTSAYGFGRYHMRSKYQKRKLLPQKKNMQCYVEVPTRALTRRRDRR